MKTQLNHFALRGVLDENPWLADYQCESCPAVEVEEFGLALDWFREDKPMPSLKRSAYSLKRDVEESTGHHVGERAFIAAALVAGYSLRRTAKAIYLV